MAADSEKDDRTIKDENGPVEDVSSDAEEGHNNRRQGKDVDVADQFLANLDPAVVDEPITDKEARKVLWKVDLILIPMIMVTAVLAALDKVIISNAAIYGMTRDTHLVGDQFSWVGSIFYFGYLIFEFPVSILIQRLPVAKFYAGNVIGWAVLLMCTAGTQNFAGLAAVRFIMGMLEACVFPISSILTVMWYSNKQQPIRVAWWFNQVRKLSMARTISLYWFIRSMLTG